MGDAIPFCAWDGASDPRRRKNVAIFMVVFDVADRHELAGQYEDSMSLVNLSIGGRKTGGGQRPVKDLRICSFP